MQKPAVLFSFSSPSSLPTPRSELPFWFGARLLLADPRPHKPRHEVRAALQRVGWRGGSWRAQPVWATGVRAEGLTGRSRAGASSRGSCGEGDGARGQEGSATCVGSSPSAARRRRRAGGVVETVTSAERARGQRPAGGKGKRQEERLRRPTEPR